MKTRIAILAAWALLGTTQLPEARADTRWSFGISVTQVRDFYEPLGSYGYWVDLPTHGRCWYPAYIGREWRPYGTGHWEWTDQGWYWVSDEPWGWATYHYGRWVYDAYYGWVWVPDTEWAPAWVSWREGGGYIGWAPLPPTGYFGPQGVLVVEHIHYEPRWWVFVEHRHFSHRHRPSTVIVHNTTIINKTVNITKVRKVVNNNTTVIVNNGPDLASVEKTAPQPVRRASAAELWKERSDRFRERANREGVKPPPVADRPPVGLRVSRDTTAAKPAAVPAAIVEPSTRGKHRDQDKPTTLPPGWARKPDDKRRTPDPAPTAAAPAALTTPAVAPEPERPEPRRGLPPGWTRKQPDPDQPPASQRWNRPTVSRPEPVSPEPAPRVEAAAQQRWQERMRALPEDRGRERRPSAPVVVPRPDSSGQTVGSQQPGPGQPAPAARPTEPDRSESDSRGRGRDRGRDARQEWEQFKEDQRKR